MALIKAVSGQDGYEILLTNKIRQYFQLLNRPEGSIMTQLAVGHQPRKQQVETFKSCLPLLPGIPG